jgi:hypothetical protein
MIRKITQFRWANEGEICGIEEKYRPFAHNILLVDRNEFAVLESHGVKGFDA